VRLEVRERERDSFWRSSRREEMSWRRRQLSNFLPLLTLSFVVRVERAGSGEGTIAGVAITAFGSNRGLLFDN
jgi:hypothetical protein